MKRQRLLQFNNLQKLLPTPTSRQQLSKSTGIPLSKINSWFDPDNGRVPKVDELILMAKYFKCTVDYLLDLDVGEQ
ncbi:MAG: homeobox domain-containing protein [Ruminococcus flavefaciens]|nr:homeobox domain-containing protein [Ruminococcus flavefaciens]